MRETLATPVWKLDFMAWMQFELKNSFFSFKNQFGLKNNHRWFSIPKTPDMKIRVLGIQKTKPWRQTPKLGVGMGCGQLIVVEGVEVPASVGHVYRWRCCHP
jgi:hypothetical protein